MLFTSFQNKNRPAGRAAGADLVPAKPLSLLQRGAVTAERGGCKPIGANRIVSTNGGSHGGLATDAKPKAQQLIYRLSHEHRVSRLRTAV